MKKTVGIVIIVLVVAVGGFLLLHKSSSKSTQAQSAGNSASSKSASNSAVILTKSNATLGAYLTDGSGNALYTYGADTTNVSNCMGSCLSDWPAYQDKGATANLPSGVSTIKRTDNGQIQFTYHGMPLYYFTSDSNGQVTGDGEDNFHVAKPVASSSTSNTSTQPAPTPAPASSSSNSGGSYNW